MPEPKLVGGSRRCSATDQDWKSRVARIAFQAGFPVLNTTFSNEGTLERRLTIRVQPVDPHAATFTAEQGMNQSLHFPFPLISP